MKQTATFTLKVEIDYSDEWKLDEAIARVSHETRVERQSFSGAGSYSVKKLSCELESIEAAK
ncbi:MAG: hypothetical protein WC100_02460 [Sterolibacterium sp.]